VVFTTLATVLNAAVADKLIPSNPCHEASVKRSRPKAASRKVVPWAAGQVDAMHDALPDRCQVLVDLGSGLGLRQGRSSAWRSMTSISCAGCSMCGVR
jgi:hypothetical protein